MKLLKILSWFPVVFRTVVLCIKFKIIFTFITQVKYLILFFFLCLCVKAPTVRDSMAKSLYGALFDWIILHINHAMLNRRDMEESVSVSRIIVCKITKKSSSIAYFCVFLHFACRGMNCMCTHVTLIITTFSIYIKCG